MSQPILRIRQAWPSDRADIASLLRQLSYDITPTEVLAKLGGIQASSADMVIVATHGDVVIGCISLHVLPLFHATGFLGRITALVVDKSTSFHTSITFDFAKTQPQLGNDTNSTTPAFPFFFCAFPFN